MKKSNMERILLNLKETEEQIEAAQKELQRASAASNDSTDPNQEEENKKKAVEAFATLKKLRETKKEWEEMRRAQIKHDEVRRKGWERGGEGCRICRMR